VISEANLLGNKKIFSSSCEEEEESLTSVDFFCTQNSAQLGLCLSSSLAGPPRSFVVKKKKKKLRIFLLHCVSIYLPIYLSTDLYNNNNPFPLLSRILDDDLRGRELLQLVPAIILACKQL
jgi:hypothetical protein